MQRILKKRGYLTVSPTKAKAVSYTHLGPDAGAELAAGKLDAVVIDAGPAAQIAGANAGLMVLETPATPEPEQYAIAIAKGEEDLKAVVDSVLEKLIADGQVQAWIDEYNEISSQESAAVSYTHLDVYKRQA